MSPTPFDEDASRYDDSFTNTFVGRRMRAAVWRRCERRFSPGTRLLEVNCGTGEDAVHLGRRGVRVLATDASEAMLEIARVKVRGAGLERAVDVARLRIEDVSAQVGTFDGLLSNFGGLNCVQDLRGAAGRLASVLTPGAVAVATIMGPCVPWEWGWYLVRGDRGRAFRRWHRNRPWRGLSISYPSIGACRRAFDPWFRCLRVSALGALVPPPFAESWAAAHPRALARLDRVERAVETVWPLPWLADHYVIELERTRR